MEKLKEVIEYWNLNNKYSKDDLLLKMENFRILFAYNSNKIENDNITYHDTREIFEKGEIINYTGNIKTLFEIQNQKDCFNYLIEYISKKEKLSVKMIKKINYLLCKNTIDERRYIINNERAGEFKKHDYVVGINEVGLSPKEVENSITELVNEINSTNDVDPIVKAAYFHCAFENIHPFSDGNGRTGRTILNYMLMIDGYPPVILFDEDKKEYYTALENYDKNEEIDLLINYIKYSLLKTWERHFNHVENV